MAKRKVVIQRFDGGIADDIREQSSNKCALVKHFDIYSNPNRLTPLRDSEQAETIGATADDLKQYDVRNFQLVEGTNDLYALGIQPASTTRTKILKNTDATDITWTTPATAESGLNGSASWRDCFIEWQDAFWMFGGSTSVSKWVIGSTFTDTVQTVGTITHVAQGVIAKDNNLYMFYNNKVVRVNSSGTVTDAVLTLPSNGRITSACSYGNRLAIAWASGTTEISGGYSKLFIWDLTSSDVSETIEWGEGQLMIVANLEGRVIGVTDSYMSSSLGQGMGSIYITAYSGGAPVILKQKTASRTVALGKFQRDVVVKGNQMFWVMSFPNETSTSDQTEQLGIWSFGRNTTSDPMALSLHVVEDAVDTSNWSIQSFGNAGNYWWINHSVDGSVTKTNDQATYTTTSIYETVKFNGGDINKTKRLVGVAVSKATTTGQVVVKYKTEADSDFVTIHTMATGSAVSQELIKIVATGKNLPEFQEIQFRLESTTGAEITGFKFVYEDDVKNLLTTV